MSHAVATPPVLLDNTGSDPRRRAPLVLGGHTDTTLTDKICGLAERPRAPRGWWPVFLLSAALALMFFVLIGYLIGRGIGVWGVQVPVAWGFAIINFVFWVGIGHAGTLISAILYLFRQPWRTGINRFAEAMTVFAVICAGIFPAIHVGRIWFAYWLFPVPNQMLMWPNFRSPLVWDVFAVSTYFTVSLLFWYLGMVPDLATLRDRATSRGRAIVYGLLSLGWCGSQRDWRDYERAYLMLAALATPLVLSVHSVVSFDFAVSSLPGWHATIMPPYFVAGAIFSGFAMVLLLAIPVRWWFGLQDIMTLRHLENMSKILLATGTMVGYAYFVEFFIAWYSGNRFEHFTFLNRSLGPYGWAYWIMVTCNVITPQLFWSKRIRKNPLVTFLIVLFVNVGMWFERFVIVVTSLQRDFLPSSWGYYVPTWVDWGMLAGSFGLFLALFLLFLRFAPIIAMAEVKVVMPRAEPAPAPAPPLQAVPRRGESGSLAGLLGEFAGPGALREAARRAREAGFSHFEAFTPFPVEGMDRAMGLPDSRLPWWTLAGGVLGCLGGLWLQWWTNAVDYPLIISGKPFFSLPANIPVAFELTVLCAALATVAGLLIGNGLPRYHRPWFRHERFRRATADRFFLFLDAADPRFDPKGSAALLVQWGAAAVEPLEG